MPIARLLFAWRHHRLRRCWFKGWPVVEPQALVKNADKVWEVTLGPLTPELYSYTFSVDGVVVADPHNRLVKKWLTVESLVEVPGDPPLAHQQQCVPHGVVHHHTYLSQTTSNERGVFVYTPPGYRVDGTEQYPLLVLMHGYGDDESAWLEVGRANWIADNLIAQDKSGADGDCHALWPPACLWHGAARSTTTPHATRRRWSRICCKICFRCWPDSIG